MKNKKAILISGSPRKGNTEYILKEVQKSLDHQSEIILLREKKVDYCKGCLSCNTTHKCIITNDDMQEICDRIKSASILVIGAPNYFDNVSGLTKSFIDRLHPFFKDRTLEGKKLIQFMVGGGKTEGTQLNLNAAMHGLTKYLYLDLVGSYSFKALDPDDIKNDESAKGTINKIVDKINAIHDGLY